MRPEAIDTARHTESMADTATTRPRLHLGCGERYLDGYVNIDCPSSEHTVQRTSPADRLADITQLRYEPESVEEVRLHRAVEHQRVLDALGYGSLEFEHAKCVDERETELRLLAEWSGRLRASA
jgi:hypothetical protein